MATIKKILLPFDFSESSNEALDLALQIAGINNAEIHLLSIIEPVVIYDTAVPANYIETVDTIKEDREAKMNKMAAEIKEKSAQTAVFSEIVMELEPADAILDKAKRTEIDLIVMGSHGRRGLSRVLMGSVAETVMRQADCPVLVLRIKETNK